MFSVFEFRSSFSLIRCPVSLSISHCYPCHQRCNMYALVLQFRYSNIYTYIYTYIDQMHLWFAKQLYWSRHFRNGVSSHWKYSNSFAKPEIVVHTLGKSFFFSNSSLITFSKPFYHTVNFSRFYSQNWNSTKTFQIEQIGFPISILNSNKMQSMQ